MKQYRQDNAAADGRIYVYYWVCTGPNQAPAKPAQTEQYTAAMPMHMIWKGITSGMAVDVQALRDAADGANPLNLEVFQMEPSFTKQQARDWAKPGGAGHALINGRPHQLLFTSIVGYGPNEKLDM